MKLFMLIINHTYAFSQIDYDEEIIFNSKEAMENFIANFRERETRHLKQSCTCDFNKIGVLVKKRVLVNYEKLHDENDDLEMYE